VSAVSPCEWYKKFNSDTEVNFSGRSDVRWPRTNEQTVIRDRH